MYVVCIRREWPADDYEEAYTSRSFVGSYDTQEEFDNLVRGEELEDGVHIFEVYEIVSEIPVEISTSVRHQTALPVRQESIQ